jgi:hypothetical protein
MEAKDIQRYKLLIDNLRPLNSRLELSLDVFPEGPWIKTADFLAYSEAAEKRIKELEALANREATEQVPLPKEPLCRECGGENMQYVEQYASGEWWKCGDCGFEGHHSRGNDR